MNTHNLSVTKALLLAGLLSLCGPLFAEPIPVELRQDDSGWTLYRGGEPYLIRGAGGDGPLDRLAAAGANSVRTWSVDGAGEVLDAAHALGMTVTVGIWLGHERHGFDYGDPQQVQAQLDAAKQAVLKYRDHPALLLWGIGNEMEGYESGDDPAIWAAVNEVAAVVKSLDPHHPTMTVTAEIGGGRIKSVHKDSPAIDIHGINSYGGATSLTQRLEEGGATKPYVVTEFGPVGAWEMPTTDWGAPYEQTSTQKADFYRQSYQSAVLDAPGRSLGAYAFLWSTKMEVTATWFGMLLENGEKLSAVDVMTELWSGAAPDNLSPVIEPLSLQGPSSVEPDSELQFTASATDPEGGGIDYQWAIRIESKEIFTGGDFRPTPPDLDGYVLNTSGNKATIRVPSEPGAYRVFAYAYDEQGNAATANMPVLVKGEPRPVMPVVVYDDQFEFKPWVPSGWMGNTAAMAVDGAHSDIVHEGEHAIKVDYTGTYGWAGVAWQDPPNNWGEQDGGFNLSGAGALELWARGEYGGEKVSFGVGLLDSGRAYPDSAIVKTETIELTEVWTKYRIDLDGEDLSSLKVGFVFTLQGRQRPITFYIDSVSYVR